ncbi:MAG TPA: hydrogenase expression/formation protein HypE [Gemmatimonadaceae bacterium]|nr:hydrogenase expression/formation protein HypE [Gemmatimonadaceae bacterium]
MSIAEPLPPPVETVRFRDAQIEMAHGAGGKASRRLVEGLFAPLFGSLGTPLTDAATVAVAGTDVVITTDAFVVRPLQFRGGSIGTLAVHGTVNDLVVSGASPCALVATFVLEAGLPGDVLEREARAMADAARRSGISIVGGDTKVVEHGKADGMYITTTGLGAPDRRVRCAAASVRPGDQVILSGPIGDHGITVLLARGDVDLDAELQSDTRSVGPLVASLVEEAAHGLRWMRDPTRGGVATALNELARDSGLGVALFEERVPVRDAVRGACELLGLDVLDIANEGQFLAVVAPADAERALDAIRAVPGGEGAAVIGEIRDTPARTVIGFSPFGGSRVIEMLVGDPLPRIC